MKKKLIIIAAIVCLAVIGLIGGCTPESGKEEAGTAGIETYVTAYSRITGAEEISESITMKNGNLTPYKWTKEYISAGNEYSYTETETRLNKIEDGTEERESATQNSGSVDKKPGAVVSLNLAEGLLKSWKINGKVFTAQIADDKLAEVFGIGETLEAPVQDAELSLELDANNFLTEISLTYRSNSYDVTIQISFSY